MTAEQTAADSIEEQRDRQRIHAMADAWFIANHKDLGHYDPVSELLDSFTFGDGSQLLEIGCANGWRLKKAREKHPKLTVAGLDPSQLAVDDAKKSDLILQKGTADYLPWPDGTFDVIVYGFCLYMVHPIYWMQVAAEGSRVLKNGGYILIHDYGNPDLPYVFTERVGIDNPHWAFHADFTKLWLGHPIFEKVQQYIIMTHTTHPQLISVLKKEQKILLARQENLVRIKE